MKRHQSIVAVIIVLKSKCFDFKTTITEGRNKDSTTIRTNWRYLLIRDKMMYSLTHLQKFILSFFSSRSRKLIPEKTC